MDDLRGSIDVNWLVERIEGRREDWRNARGDAKSCAKLLIRRAPMTEATLAAALELVLRPATEESDFARILDIHEYRADLVTDEHIRALRDEFAEFVDDQVRYILHDAEDAEMAQSMLEELDSLATRLEVEAEVDRDEIEHRIQQLEEKDRGGDEDYDEDRWIDARADARAEEREIDSMFDSLKSK